MLERHHFAQDLDSRQWTMSELCRRYGISRKTGYPWLDRYARLGPDSLADRSHRPDACPHATAPAVIREIRRPPGRRAPADGAARGSGRTAVPSRCRLRPYAD